MMHQWRFAIKKNELHMYVANLVCNYKRGGVFLSDVSCRLLRLLLLLQIHFS